MGTFPIANILAGEKTKNIEDIIPMIIKKTRRAKTTLRNATKTY